MRRPCFGRAPARMAGVPEQDLPVGAGRDEGVATGAEIDPPDAVAVAAKDEDFVARADVQQPDGPVPARGRQPAAVGAECDPFDQPRTDLERENLDGRQSTSQILTRRRRRRCWSWRSASRRG